MERKSSTILSLILIVFGGIVLGILLFLGAGVFYDQSFQGRIFRGVSVGNVIVGGLTPEEAAQRLCAQIRYPIDSAYSFEYNGQRWGASPQELGFSLQAENLAKDAYKIGRSASFIGNTKDRISALLHGKNLDPVFLFDERVAFNFITKIAETIDVPMGQPSITLQGSEIQIDPGQTGYQVDRASAMTQLQIYALNLQSAEISLPVNILEPTEANLGAQKQVLENLLSQDFTLYTNDERGYQPADTIPAEVLAGMIDFEPVISGSDVTITMAPKWEPFYNRLVETGSSVYREAALPRLSYSEYLHAFQTIEPAVTGKKINIEASMQNITNALRAGENQAQVALDVEEPMIRENVLPEELGIMSVVHTENTYFFYSDDARIQNIQVGAGKLNGQLIAPGETFSMADRIGEVSPETGYAESSVIFGDSTIQDVGGGLCQVSTTLFRAAFNYGLQIDERHAHGYRVYYYERLADKQLDPGLAGLDAAVYLPDLDLKITNDTPYWILMETNVDTELNRLQWKFWSTPVNRYVTYETSGLTNVEEEGDPIYNYNPELPSGTIKQVDWGIAGADVTITRTVLEDGYIHINDKFETHYAAWNDIFEYGPNTPGIPTQGEEDDGTADEIY